MIFLPQAVDSTTDFRSLNRTFSIPAHLPPAWKVWLRSIQQSKRNRRWTTSATHRSEGEYKLANISQAWFGRILCCLHHPVQNLSCQNERVLLFRKIHSFGHHDKFSVGGFRQTVTFFDPQLNPLQISEVWQRVFYSISSAVCVESLVKIRSAVSKNLSFK